MKRKYLPVLTLLAVLIAADAAAQRFEITPFGGYRWGGTLDDGIRPVEPEVSIDLQFDNGASYGLTAGYFVKPNIQIEAFFDRQHTALKLVNSTFGQEQKISDGKIDYYHVGVLMLLMSPDDPLQPFFSISGGRTRIAPENGPGSENFWSIGAALGVRYFLTDRLGVRAQSRMMSTVITEEARYFCEQNGDDCLELPANTWMLQVDLSFGVIVAF